MFAQKNKPAGPNQTQLIKLNISAEKGDRAGFKCGKESAKCQKTRAHNFLNYLIFLKD